MRIFLDQAGKRFVFFKEFQIGEEFS